MRQTDRTMRHLRENDRMPEWFVGLLIAAVLTVIGYLVLKAMGAGDDPTFSGALTTLLV